MPNVMVALPNVRGSLCSTPQSLARAHCSSACSNATKIRECKTWRMQSQCCTWHNFVMGQEPPKMGFHVLATLLHGLISATGGSMFTIFWRHVQEILLLNKFFSDCRYVRYLQRYSLTKFCDGAQMASFWLFFASCICSEPRAERFRPASEIRTKAIPCVEVWQTSNLRRLRLGEEKKIEEEETTGWKCNGLAYSIGDHNNTSWNFGLLWYFRCWNSFAVQCFVM